ncbi:MAG: hypothetical protein JHC95_10425 [Solirubrobacteraceae bacterium]|nr:hypothetical protein [Solirubrobacteraceae bacterium]
MSMKLIVWAPGEIGAAALKRALLDPGIDVVGVKVYSPSKHGTDIGTLVGLNPVGVRATTDVDEIYALDADVVVHTPKPFAAMQGGDYQVLALLESGKNVVSTLSYFCPGLAGSMSEERPLSEQLATVATATGPMPRAVRGGQAVARFVNSAARLPGVRSAALPAIDRGLGAIVDRFELRRPAPRRFSEALAAGGTTLHGTGLNPGYMAEQVTVALAGLVDGVRHIHFVECGDLSEAPEGMWVGLDGIGFGSEPESIGPTHAFALGSEIYQPEVVANVGHSVFGLHPDAIDQDVDLRALPAKERITAGGITIEPGQTAVLNQTHHGRDERTGELFYTNEMCWFVGVPNGYYSETVPFGPMGQGGYTMVIDADPLTVRSQMTVTSTEPGFGGVTDVSVNMVFDALVPAIENESGVLINDMRPAYDAADGTTLTAPDRWAASQAERRRIAILGRSRVADAVARLAEQRPEIEHVGQFDRAADVVAIGVDCAVVTGAADVAELLAAGIDVVTDGPAPEAVAGATLHSTGNHASVVAGRMVNLLSRGTSGVKHVRYVDALDLAGADEARREALGLGSDVRVDADTALASIEGRSTMTVDAAAAAALGVATDRLTFTTKIKHRVAGKQVVAVHVTRTAKLGRSTAVTHEIIRYLGAEHADRGADLPLGGFTEETCITVGVTGVRGAGGTQIEFASSTADRPEDLLVASALLDAVGPVCAAAPGLLTVRHEPRYRTDDRMPSVTRQPALA